MAIGTVKFFNADRGFGFLMPDDGGVEVFVHIRQVVSSQILTQGLRVAFETGLDARKGKPEALNVRIL